LKKVKKFIKLTFVIESLVIFILFFCPIMGKTQASEDASPQSVPLSTLPGARIIDEEITAPQDDLPVVFQTDKPSEILEIQDPFKLRNQADDDDGEIPYRVVRIQLSRVRGSSGYEAEFFSVDDVKKKTTILRNRGTQFRIFLSPGRYRIRTRSLDKSDRMGLWGNWTEFPVRFKPPKEIYPADGAVVKAVKSKNEKIFFEWPLIPKATGYLFELREEDGRLIQRKVVKNFYLSARLDIKKTYRWGLLPLAYEGEEAEHPQIKATNAFRLVSPLPNTTPVFIEATVDGTEDLEFRYQYQVFKFSADGRPSAPAVFESPSPEFRIRFEPGEYGVQVQTVYKRLKKSTSSPLRRFFIPLGLASIKNPRSNEVFPATTKESAAVTLSWFQNLQAKRYILFVYNQKGELIQKVETEKTSASVQLKPEASYRAYVQAYLPGEPERLPPSGEKGSVRFKVEQYFDLKLSQGEEPRNLYGRLHWIGSMVDYFSNNYDSNSRTTNSIFGGTGQVALGYWHKRTSWGLLAFGEMSGFTINSVNYFYHTLGLQVGRRFVFEEGRRVRFWLGGALRDLPELLTRPMTTYLNVDQIQAQGLYVQGDYLRPWIKNFDLYFHANYFQDIGQGRTPNGRALSFLRGGALGLYVSRSFGENYRGRMGYSYRFDNSSYDSIRSGRQNTVDISGHFISLILDVAIGKQDEQD